MGTGSGKGVTTTVSQALIRACVHRLITGGERWSGLLQGPHDETLFMHCVHCRQRTRGKEWWTHQVCCFQPDNAGQVALRPPRAAFFISSRLHFMAK